MINGVVGTLTICRALGIPPVKVNEAIFLGHIPTPDMSETGYRQWDHEGCLTLAFWAKLRAGDFAPRTAGRYTNAFHDLLRKRNAKSGHWARNLSHAQKAADIVVLIGANDGLQADFANDPKGEVAMPDGEGVALRMVIPIAELEAEVESALAALPSEEMAPA